MTQESVNIAMMVMGAISLISPALVSVIGLRLLASSLQVKLDVSKELNQFRESIEKFLDSFQDAMNKKVEAVSKEVGVTERYGAVMGERMKSVEARLENMERSMRIMQSQVSSIVTALRSVDCFKRECRIHVDKLGGEQE